MHRDKRQEAPFDIHLLDVAGKKITSTLERILAGHPYLYIFLAFMILHSVVALRINVITIMPDEMGTLAYPAWLAGYDWSGIVSHYRNYYGYGQAIFYYPLFLLIEDGLWLSRCVLMVNAVQVSLVPLIAYKMITGIFGYRRSLFSFLTAVAVGTHPAYLCFSKRAWNESLIMLLFWITVFLIADTVKKHRDGQGNMRNSLLLALCLGYGYMTHGRFLGIVATVCAIWGLYALYYKKSLLNPAVFLGGLFSMILLDSRIKGFFLREIWRVSDTSEIRSVLTQVIGSIVNALNFNVVLLFFRCLNGFFFYLFIASLAMLPLFYIFFFSYVKRAIKNVRKEPDPVLALGTFCAISVVFSVVLAAAFYVPDYYLNFVFIRGRYSEYLLGPFFLFAAIYISRIKVEIRQWALGVSVFFTNSILTAVLEYKDTLKFPQGEVHPNTAYTLVSFTPTYRFSGIHAWIMAISIAALAFLIITLFIKSKKSFFAYLLIIGVFISSYAISANKYLIPSSMNSYQGIRSAYEILSEVRRHSKNPYEIFIHNNVFGPSWLSALKWGRFSFVNSNTRISDSFINDDAFFVTESSAPISSYYCDYENLYEVGGGSPQSSVYDKVYVYGSALAEEMKSYGLSVEPFPFELSREYDFKDANITAKYAGSGWNISESELWSDGSESTLRFEEMPEDVPEESFEMLLSADGTTKLVDVAIGGIPATTIKVVSARDQFVSVPIPEDAAYSRNVTFKIREEGGAPSFGKGISLKWVGFFRNNTYRLLESRGVVEIPLDTIKQTDSNTVQSNGQAGHLLGGDANLSLAPDNYAVEIQFEILKLESNNTALVTIHANGKQVSDQHFVPLYGAECLPAKDSIFIPVELNEPCNNIQIWLYNAEGTSMRIDKVSLLSQKEYIKRLAES